MYVMLQENDRDWDEDLEGAKFIARTIGCGCCAHWVKVTPKVLAEHIENLKAQLTYAESIQSQIKD